MWLELLREDCGIALTDTLLLEKEADELMAVMTTMINRTKGKSGNLVSAFQGSVFVSDDFNFLFSQFLLLKR
jgi:hypothetical protein